MRPVKGTRQEVRGEGVRDASTVIITSQLCQGVMPLKELSPSVTDVGLHMTTVVALGHVVLLRLSVGVSQHGRSNLTYLNKTVRRFPRRSVEEVHTFPETPYGNKA